MHTQECLVPPSTPTFVKVLNDNHEPCAYCGSLLHNCPSVKVVAKCNYRKVSTETEQLLKDMRDTQNYKLST